MSIQDIVKGTFWLFDTAIFLRRFDVLDSPTGRFNDLSWELGENYRLPQISALSEGVTPIELYGAWHEKGLFFQTVLPIDHRKPDFHRFTPKMVVRLLVNTRHAPGIQRPNSNCIQLETHLERVNSNLNQSNSSLEWKKLSRSKELDPIEIDKNLTPCQLEWVIDDLAKLKVFVAAQCLPNFNATEFPDISFDLEIGNRYHSIVHYANTQHTGLNDNPSLWCRAKLAEDL